MNKLIASIGGIGYIKGGGTIAAAVTCGAIWLLWSAGISVFPFTVLCVAVTLLVINTGADFSTNKNIKTVEP